MPSEETFQTIGITALGAFTTYKSNDHTPYGNINTDVQLAAMGGGLMALSGNPAAAFTAITTANGAIGFSLGALAQNLHDGNYLSALNDSISIAGNGLIIAASALYQDPLTKPLAIRLMAEGEKLALVSVSVEILKQSPTILTELATELNESIVSWQTIGTMVPPNFASSRTGTAFGAFETAFFYGLTKIYSGVNNLVVGNTNIDFNPISSAVQNTNSAVGDLYISSGATSNNVDINLQDNGYLITDNGSKSSGYYNYDLDGNIIVASSNSNNFGGISSFNIFSNNINTGQDKANVVANIAHKLKADGANTDGTLTTATFTDAENNTTSTAKIYGGDAKQLVQKLGGTAANGITTATAGNGETVISLISDAASTVVNGVTYAATQIVDSVVSAGTAVANFINTQTGNYLHNTFDTYNINQAISSFFSKHGQELASGNLSAANAAKYFVIELAEGGLSDTIIRSLLSPSMNTLRDAMHNGVSAGQLATLNNAAQLNDSFSGVLKELGFTNPASLSVQLQDSFVKMAIEFALHSNGWNAEQYVKAGASIVSGIVVADFVNKTWGESFGVAGSAGTGAALTTLVVSIINNGFDQNWGNVALSAGMAFGTAYATSQLGTLLAGANALPWLSTSQALGNAIVGSSLYGTTFSSIIGGAALAGIGLVVGLAVSKIASSLFGSAVYHDGEFGDTTVLLNSIYQVQQVDDGTGHMVDALVAVNANGATIIAQGITTVIGNIGQDVLVGTAAADSIYGGGGSDYLEGREGNDTLVGGDGADHISGGAGDDFISGGAGDDIIFGDAGNDTVVSDSGDDFVHLGSGDDSAATGDGNDIVMGGAGNDSIDSGTGDDIVDGGAGDDVISAGDGKDLVFGNSGNDLISMGAGDDVAFGEAGNDQLYGGDGNDLLSGGDGIDILHGENGIDDFRAAIRNNTDRDSVGLWILWLHIARLRSGQQDNDIEISGSLVPEGKWPAPLMALYRGEGTVEEVFSKAKDGNATEQADQMCDANFYTAEFYLLQGMKEKARPLFQAAIDTCPKIDLELAMAKAELKALK